MQNIILLIVLWLVYFLIHSYLANLRVKKALIRTLPPLANSYRLFYNFLALILLIPQFYLMYAIPSSSLWQWSGQLKIFANLLTVIALLGFVWSLKYYNNMDFLGFSQLQKRTSRHNNQFTLSPLHRHIRHPWYFFALILIWTRDMDVHFLVSAVCITIYFIVGSLYEERKLVVEFGQAYCDYQQAVPGLIPSVRRFLTRTQAESLLNKHKRDT